MAPNMRTRPRNLSARVYDYTAEALSLGRTDAMRRTGLLPIADFMREAEAQGRPASSLRLLELAAGTGRFHTFIKDAYPDLPSVVSDLSPFYLARARSNLRYWRSLRQPSRQLGGVDDTGTEFLQTAAEAIAAPDESFDIVVCVYLFHELPEPVRRAAVSEFFRVLRPGGLAVLTDSVQLGDRRAWENTAGSRAGFNDSPHYQNYVGCDLGAMFQAAGFECGTKYVCSATKTLSFRKPGALAAAPTAAPPGQRQRPSANRRAGGALGGGSGPRLAVGGCGGGYLVAGGGNGGGGNGGSPGADGLESDWPLPLGF
ncbi:hypothetical protein GPECTOR_41g653 [Gonium pectorale]|uniref:Methyltransferase domain-containing protein n=1 Tax=Gonium pectorale TaxID=33097 RepID=A0A150GA20_GONPE|nr:hypothetical protein GPECTOR_41g653 [Gonium pectorale]|eukprot:KXZ46689.1 hypothetical protein GPECTOR_41g653 [Gonium pectorale]